MRIVRRHTTAANAPYVGLSSIRGTYFRDVGQPIAFRHPDSWDAAAIAEIIKILPKVPADTGGARFAEEDVPDWLWRAEPAQQDEPEASGIEPSLFVVIDRIVGAITYQGWKAGYFDTTDDASAYSDEMRWMIARRRLCPEPGLWRSAGLFWAYGRDISDPESCIVGWQTGRLSAVTPDTMPLYGNFLLGPDENARRETGLLSLRQTIEKLRESGAGWAVNPTLADQDPDALRRFCADAPTGGVIALDPDYAGYPHIRDDAQFSDMASAAAAAGDRIFRRHIAAIIECWKDEIRQDHHALSPVLRMAILAAEQVGVPEPALDALFNALAHGEPVSVDDIMGPPPELTPRPATDRTIVAADPHGDSNGIADFVRRSCARGDHVSVLFPRNAASAAPVGDSGEIRAVDRATGLVFYDDIVAPSLSINVSGVNAGAEDGTGLDIEQAVTLAAITLDITVDLTPAPTPRIARRVWDYRPVNISLCGAAENLASIAPHIAASAWETSLALAEERGGFPRHRENLNRLKNRFRAQFRAVEDLTSDAADRWRTLAGIDQPVARNSMVISAPANDFAAAILGIKERPARPAEVADCRLSPEKLASILKRLKALGYGEDRLSTIARHVSGARCLADSPGINYTTLRRCGFSEAALKRVEETLPAATALSQCFSVAVLGHEFCVAALQIPPADLDSEEFDILAELGFSDAAIEAASRYILGTGALANAPELASEDYESVVRHSWTDAASPVERQIKQAGQAQCFMSGLIGHRVSVSDMTTRDQIAGWIAMAERAGVAGLVFEPGRKQETRTDFRKQQDGRPDYKPVLIGNDVIGINQRADDPTTSRPSTVSPKGRRAASVSSSTDSATEQRQP